MFSNFISPVYYGIIISIIIQFSVGNILIIKLYINCNNNDLNTFDEFVGALFNIDIIIREIK